jgi:single-stranded DNA-binding protein
MSGIEAAFFGALGRDAEPKVSGAGKPYLRANIRVGDGEAAQWVSVLAFDEKAIAAADNFVKGARVYVEGRMTLDKWSKDGAERVGFSCMSWHCRLAQIGRNKTKRTRSAAPSVAAGSADFGGGTSQAGRGDMDDEIPF